MAMQLIAALLLGNLTNDGFSNHLQLILAPFGVGIEQLTYERDMGYH